MAINTVVVKATVYNYPTGAEAEVQWAFHPEYVPITGDDGW